MKDLLDYLRDELKNEVSKVRVKDVRVGVIYTGVVLSSGHGGVAYMPVHEFSGCHVLAYAGSITGRSALNVMNMALSPKLVEVAIGIATVNALSQMTFEIYPEKYILSNIDVLDDRSTEKCLKYARPFESNVIEMKRWELIVVGGGVAGLTAGIYGARSGLETLVLEEKVPGGAAADAPLIENYPGFPQGISGMDLTKKLVEQAERMEVEIHQLEKAIKLDLKAKAKRVKTDKTVYITTALVLASGSHHQALGILGEEEFRGRGVSYCAVCDGAFFKGGKVIVVGGGNSAAVSAIYLSNLASDVKLAHRRDRLRAEDVLVKNLRNQKVEIMWNTEIKEIKGDVKVETVLFLNNKTGELGELKVDGVFVQVGEKPNSQFAQEAGVKVDIKGYIIVDGQQRTNLEGVYAAGDVTVCPVKQVGTAVGQAIIAATEAFGYIKRPYYYKG